MTRISADTGGTRPHSREKDRQKVKVENAQPDVVGLGTAIELQGRSGMNVTFQKG